MRARPSRRADDGSHRYCGRPAARVPLGFGTGARPDGSPVIASTHGAHSGRHGPGGAFSTRRAAGGGSTGGAVRRDPRSQRSSRERAPGHATAKQCSEPEPGAEAHPSSDLHAGPAERRAAGRGSSTCTCAERHDAGAHLRTTGGRAAGPSASSSGHGRARARQGQGQEGQGARARRRPRPRSRQGGLIPSSCGRIGPCPGV